MDWKRLGKKFLFPPAVVPLLLLPVCAGALAYAFRSAGGSVSVQTAACALSFYTLAVLCARLPGFFRFCRKLSGRNRYAALWKNDVRFRMNVTLTVNVVWNSVYALAQLALGIYHRSFWFYSLAGYYFSLAFIRFFLVRHTMRYRPGEEMRRELKLYRDCGWSFLAINLALSCMILLMVSANRTVRHHQITVIAMAAYTFAAFAAAVVGAARYRRYNSPVCSASKRISLAAACVSTLTLEGSMLASFRSESMTPQTQRLFLALSGGALSIFIVVTAVFMIVSASSKLKRLETTSMEKKDSFKMTYSARQQEEIMAIRKKYAAPEEDKMEQLRAMDASVGKKAVSVSIAVGIAGTLLLGLGMSFTMSEFGSILGTLAMPAGIIIGLAGICILACAYPLYNRTLKKERRKVAAEIIRLTNELMK